MVNSKLDFYPIESDGFYVYKFSQSVKWREELPEDIRVQMVVVLGKHFYIYEPTQLLDGSLVIPIFFYSAHGELYAKCIRPRTSGVVSKDNVKLLIPNHLPYRSEHLFSVKCSDFNRIYSEILINGFMVERLYGNCIWGQLLMMLSMQLNQTDRNVTSPHVIGIGDGVSKQIPFPNPWRLRAGGRVIRHMPITLTFPTSSPSLAFHPQKPISNTTVTFFPLQIQQGSLSWLIR
ncbi:hypothetical protein VP01_1362g3 [Puccinia sorghi]|uniref:Uncharacterized protein n=1 Tax=Puccinia sorghi TaxID=27349 RepID=A0A0L6VNM7_9BASI|nr:hypothetical protein VP01_1362g3 [Puccinia sorghi]